MARYDDYKDRIDHLIEYPEIYDGWSVAKLTDGTLVNRWENDEGTGPEPGYGRRWALTAAAIARHIEYMKGEPWITDPAQRTSSSAASEET